MTAEPDQVLGVIKPAFADIGATVLDYSPATDGDAFVVRGDSPAAKISDVKNLDYVFGASPQCETGPSATSASPTPPSTGSRSRSTRRSSSVRCWARPCRPRRSTRCVWNTTAPQIKEHGFKVLEDDKGLFPAQNIAPIVATSVLADGDPLAADLNTLSAAITTDDLVAWNMETDIKFRESDDVATEWLEKKGLD